MATSPREVHQRVVGDGETDGGRYTIDKGWVNKEVEKVSKI